MKVELSPGDELLITLEDTDGEFRITFDKDGNKKVQVFANMPDDKDRGGDEDLPGDQPGKGKFPYNPEIYCEDFSRSPDGLMEVAE